jgi:threonine/homoserine/homoserine lactone efflux protein
MLLQIAIGPVFIYIFKTAASSGILAAESGVLAATLMDLVFVTLAILGIGSLLDKPRVKIILKYFGAAVLGYFGIGIILGTVGINIIPSFGGASPTSAANVFATTFILTASSPLSILFWTGVFATKLSCEGYQRKEMMLFGIGAVLATLVFLGIFAIIAGLLQPVMNYTVINILNFIVGMIIVGFGIKMLFTKDKALQ